MLCKVLKSGENRVDEEQEIKFIMFRNSITIIIILGIIIEGVNM